MPIPLIPFPRYSTVDLIATKITHFPIHDRCMEQDATHDFPTKETENLVRYSFHGETSRTILISASVVIQT